MCVLLCTRRIPQEQATEFDKFQVGFCAQGPVYEMQSFLDLVPYIPVALEFKLV